LKVSLKLLPGKIGIELKSGMMKIGKKIEKFFYHVYKL